MEKALPQDWKIFSLDDLFEFANGVNADKSAYGKGAPFANVFEVINNEWLTEKLIPGRIQLSPALVNRYQVRRGDVLFNRTSETQQEVGLASVYLGDSSITFGGFVFRAQPKTKELDEDYSKYAFRARSVRDQIEPLGQGAIRANVSQRDLKAVRIALPPLDEQRNISAALGDVDELIALLNRLLIKRQAVKQGLMRHLLTGRTRLARFNAPWRTVHLGDHVTYVKPVALSRAQLDTSSPLRYLHYGDIHTATDVRLDAANVMMPRAESALAGSAGRLQIGDLVFADASEDPGGVGKSIEITSVPAEGIIPGLHTIAARFDKAVLADDFKAHLQFIPHFRQSLLRLAAGTKVLATTRSNISSIAMLLPPIEEQQAIAKSLLDADQEINTLRDRITKAKAIKQGMMQELLTGRTRLTA
ncbi:restriction endonuclease subunit S [Kitasatospora cineracea]|uniref:restriction endonuclease subunit S n=1 Tax=Kitasatospora cineracea TaxID=88074 RepID=UPI00380D5C56